MKRYKLALLGGALLLALAACGCDKLKSRDHLNKGVQAYRNAQFQIAIMHFKEAVRLDPSLLNARLYLATAYRQQYVPGGESADNIEIAHQAIDAFQDVLKRSNGDKSADATALASIAQTYYEMKDFDKAKEFNEQRIKIEPNNPEPYYWIGVLDWAICFPRSQTVRVDHNVSQPDKNGQLPPIPAKFRGDLADKNGPLVEEGLKALQKAIDLRPNDADTMAYLNLMYRQKADIESDDADRQADLKQADDWVDKSVAARKLAANQPSSSSTASQ
jgi:tetratricopeptide (TPR) repeat protein